MHPLQRPKIQASDETIEQAVSDASAPALLMSMLHMTGDEALLQSDLRPRPPEMLDLQCGLDATEQKMIRAQAVTAIKAYRDSGCPEIAPPSEVLLDRMIAFVLGEQEISEPYRTILMEELDLGQEDPRRLELNEAGQRNVETGFGVAIIGAGMSGLLLGVRLAQAGIPFTIFEKNEGVGGTWFENRYPGCRVDIASHCYSYSFASGDGWREFFGRQDELQTYFNSVAQDYDLLSHIEFSTTVSRAEFNPETGRWQVEASQNGHSKKNDFNVLVSAVGQLNRAKIPNIEGRESFHGTQMHTAQWDPSIDLQGKRIAVVGSGASAFQMVPELAKTADSVTVFQRTPQWMFPNPGYHAAVSDGQSWCFRFLPGYERWFRLLSLWPMTDKAYPQLEIDPEWEGSQESCGPANHAMRENLSAYIESQVHDPRLLEKVLPKYPPFGTRVLQDNGAWLSTLQRENVELVAEGVSKVSPQGLESESGKTFDVDIIVWATGFHADRFLWPMELVGDKGRTLREEWKETPSAYLGITTPGFPNLFYLYGPNTNVAHTANVIFVSECQARYIGSAIKLMLEEDRETLECKREVANEYEERLEQALAQLVWSHPSVHSFYRSASGRVVVNMPWMIADYWEWTREINPRDFADHPGSAGLG